ncbi:MAG: polyhydroxybutyrate depolymerase [Candidatus Wallbacteria bacterium]|nr:polyhydroxybutyrate depolymerase [Candidatus Wallbacteria bacterium]
MKMKTSRMAAVVVGAAALGLLATQVAECGPPRPPALAEAQAGKRVAPGDYERLLAFGGRQRRYELHVPASYDATRPVSVVLDFHGGGGSASGARRGTNMDRTSERGGFLAVYPDGTGRFARRMLTWNAGYCCGYAQKQGVDDVGFTAALLDDLARFFRVDAKRVYATGLSNGGLMSYRLACELPERIAAIASVAGPMGVEDCRPGRPVPVMHIHGTADQNAPYEGGVGAHSITRLPHRSVAWTLARWRELNRCAGAPKIETKGRVRTESWTPSPGGAEIVLITIEGGGHVWPGGAPLLPRFVVGEDVAGFDAAATIWGFFARHRLP